jgi:hypothetical protein
MTATLERAPADPGGPTWRDRLQPATTGRDPLLGWLAALGVGLLAGVLRFVRLDIPPGGSSTRSTTPATRRTCWPTASRRRP